MRIRKGNIAIRSVTRLAAALITVCLFIASCSVKNPLVAKHESKVDYSKPGSWVCFNEDGGSKKEADCFLICPTVYVTRGKGKNMSVNDPTVKPSFINAVNAQKALYSDSCAIYAPFYSQASIEVYGLPESEAGIFFETAYADIENAFIHYLNNSGVRRPLVLAGFSQGADMCIRLLKDHGNDPEVKNRLVKQNKSITHDRIISELTLGFWTTLFSKRYNQYKFQSVLVKNVFQNCPKSKRNIKNLQVCVDEIRELRNRVCHYENIIHYPDITQKYKNIKICISWISVEISKIIR